MNRATSAGRSCVAHEKPAMTGCAAQTVSASSSLSASLESPMGNIALTFLPRSKGGGALWTLPCGHQMRYSRPRNPEPGLTFKKVVEGLRCKVCRRRAVAA